MEVKYYEKRPHVVEAIQLSPYNYEEVCEWVGGQISLKHQPLVIRMTVPNVSGNLTATLKYVGKKELFWTDLSEMDNLADLGRLQEFSELDKTKWYGDFIIKQRGRFTVMTEYDFNYNYLELTK